MCLIRVFQLHRLVRQLLVELRKTHLLAGQLAVETLGMA